MSTIDPLTRRHLRVLGQVQGVGFRWFARETASTLGLSGWVRNREDGSVEAEVEGTQRSLNEFVKRLREDHPSARVDSIEMRPIAARGDRGFVIE
ncbi:MAG: acylphosphatase [Elusimicrobiota bacterium]